MPDPLHDALVQATMATLLGSTDIQQQTVDQFGHLQFSTVTIPSAFQERLRQMSRDGKFDGLIMQAMEKITVDNVARAIEEHIADQFKDGLKIQSDWGRSNPGWLQVRAKDIAAEACKAAVSNDDEILTILREKIGMEVDRNRVGINVQLSDPET